MRRPQRGLFLAISSAIALSFAGAAGPAIAHVAETPPADLAWDDTSVSIEYGDWLNLNFSGASWLDGYSCCLDETNPITVIASGVPGDFEVGNYFSSSGAGVAGSAYQTGEGRPLESGSYTFVLKAVYVNDVGDTVTEESAPATVTVEPAGLTAVLSAEPDEGVTGNMIFGATLNGKFADTFGSEDFPNAPLAPKGTWHFTVKDASATQVATNDVTANGALAASWYWTGGEPGKTYTVDVNFDSATATAADFDVSQADDVTFTTAAAARAEPTSTAPPAPPTTAVAPQGFQAPVWLAGLITVLMVVFLASSIYVVLRYRRLVALPIGASDVQ